MGKWHVCTTCPAIHEGTGKCPACLAKTRAVSDRDRRPQGNPYNGRGHKSFRAAVLARDPVCVLCGLAPATVADHYPTERRDLVAAGLDPDDPERGRALCKPCHDKVTGSNFGWGRR
jgi:hypothetical protein